MQQQVRYFRSQVFTQSDEMSEAEALSARHYVAVHYINGELDYAKIHDGQVVKVVYYERPPADEAFIAAHRAKYSNTAFQIITPLSISDGKGVREIYHYDESGALLGVDREHLDERGNLTTEVRMDASRQVIGKIEYEYDAQGALSKARELDPDGTLVYEYEPEK